MSLIAFSVRLDRIDESLLYQDKGGGFWLSAVCTLDTDANGRQLIADIAPPGSVVVKAGETTREAGMHACRQLASAKARLFGVIVNAIDFSNPAYGYEYYYRNYYRYGYSYGNGPDQRATS
jgi:Mrp family chromosome partitioning ATPase